MALTFLTNSSYSVFLTTSSSTILLSLLKSKGMCFNLSETNLSTLIFKLFKPLGTYSNSSIPNLSISDFKLAKSAFLEKSDFQQSDFSTYSVFKFRFYCIMRQI